LGGLLKLCTHVRVGFCRVRCWDFSAASALFEVNPKTLQAEIGPHVARSVAFFLAACRHGGVHLAGP
jgi:hypothetical protein